MLVSALMESESREVVFTRDIRHQCLSHSQVNCVGDIVVDNKLLSREHLDEHQLVPKRLGSCIIVQRPESG